MPRRRSSWAILAIAALVGLVVMMPAVGGYFERALGPVRFALQSRPASGNVVVVEMDARSVAAIRRWPWPRSHYARVVDRLRIAGAASIVFDVDVSTASEPSEDRAFAAAIARADGRVALATFDQQAARGDQRSLDALPLPILRPHASLASVSVAPDVDGLVRDVPLATITAGTPRPSLSAYIAARGGTADATFPVNFAIDPATIPHLSFVAVEEGHFDPATVRGRNVLIGATAIEMGDRYPVPLHGVLPGVTIQALAAETLLEGVPSSGTAMVPFLLALVLSLASVETARRRTAAIGLVAGVAIQASAVLAAQRWLGIHYPLAIGLLMLTAVGLMLGVRDVVRRFRRGRLVDEPTGLPNGRAFTARPPDLGAVCAVRLSNLDALAAVLGPEHMAQAIVRTAERLRLASADGLVYRVRGQQLAFKLPTEQVVDDTLAGLRAVLLEPIEVGGRKVDVAIAIGVAEDGDLSAAVLAAAEAHAAGAFWRRAALNRDTLERSVSLMGELDTAIGAGQIHVFYQPKLAIAADRIGSVEALVRWKHPERGFVPPDAFIPLAEQTDRIESLTLYILETVLRDVAHWRAAGHQVSAAINISARLLTAPSFTVAVDALLDASTVPSEALIFEVTESAAMSDPAAAVATLNHFRARGLGISMDDYGTGQSTLSYIRELPLSELKIDRSFVQFAHERENDAKLVTSTIALAHSLGLKVVAEGIEDAANLAFLRANGCDYAQGYFISRPVPLDALLELFAARRGEKAA
jgi:EAL domain-containing protein (putative c-di-GMP-specific phosphodiesterase class I)/CHASE2 domain-containing sensor protein